MMQFQILQKEQRQRENAFYQFLYQISTSPTSNNNQIYYKKFLKSQFNTFAVGEGYPLISLECESPLCYFYVKIQVVSDFQHQFLKYINQQLTHYSCRNCRRKVNRHNVVYDTALGGLIQSKISKKQLQSIKIAQITKHHQIFLEKNNGFNEAFNNQRLKTISLIRQSANKMQHKCLKVNSFELINFIHDNLMNSLQFTGKMKPSKQLLITSQNKDQSILAICIYKNSRLYLHVLKQFKDSQSMIKIELQVEDKLGFKLAEYYDNINHIFYYLTEDGILYKCDLRYMYNFSNSKYHLQKWCTFSNFPTERQQYANQLVVRQDDIYFFVSKKQKRFIELLKAKLPSERNSQPIELKPILNDQIFNRWGYSVSFIPKKVLLKEQCIIIFGGMIQKKTDFKLFEVIVLDQVQKYINIKLSVEQSDFPLVGHILYPVISISSGCLVVVGGYDQVKMTENTSICMISLKQRQKIIKQDYAPPRKGRIQNAYFSSASYIGTSSTTILIGNSYNNPQVITISKSNKSRKPIINCMRYS